MFSKNIRLFGKHANLLKKFSQDTQGDNQVHFIVDDNEGNEENIYIFDTLIQCYMVSTMLGIINNRKGNIEYSSDKSMFATIFVEVLIKNKDHLDRIYQHMILTENNQLEMDEKVKLAFNIVPEDKEKEEMDKINSYACGGLEILEDLFGRCKSYEDLCNALNEINLQYSVENI